MFTLFALVPVCTFCVCPVCTLCPIVRNFMIRRRACQRRQRQHDQFARASLQARSPVLRIRVRLAKRQRQRRSRSQPGHEAAARQADAICGQHEQVPIAATHRVIANLCETLCSCSPYSIPPALLRQD